MKRLLGHTLLIVTLVAPPVLAHNGITVGHSPADPNGTGTCPSLAPMKLFLLNDPAIGGEIPAGYWLPPQPGAASTLARIALNAILARPEFGGFVYVNTNPGVHFVDASTPCHAMTSAFTGGAAFRTFLQRTYWPDGENLAIADSFGNLLLEEDGDNYAFGDENGAHFHPLWLTRRGGTFAGELRITSDVFSASDDFSLVFVSSPSCVRPVALDLQSVFNVDVVDSDASDTPYAFDGAGRAWLLNGHLGTSRGLPQNGQLDVFQLGGPSGASLAGAANNCLIDDGVHSCAASVDFTAQGVLDAYESVELLLGAAGSFTSNDRLVVTLTYETGSPQSVNVRRAASSPRYFPLEHWHVSAALPAHLSVGPSGSRAGGGFHCSNGAAIDVSQSPADGYYLKRVTFPTDPTRRIRSISFADYSGAGRIGIFAVTAMRGVGDCPGAGCQAADIEPRCGDCDVDEADLGLLLANWQLQGATREQGDTNGDARVDEADLGTLLGAWGSSCR